MYCCQKKEFVRDPLAPSPGGNQPWKLSQRGRLPYVIQRHSSNRPCSLGSLDRERFSIKTIVQGPFSCNASIQLTSDIYCSKKIPHCPNIYCSTPGRPVDTSIRDNVRPFKRRGKTAGRGRLEASAHRIPCRFRWCSPCCWEPVCLGAEPNPGLG